MGEILLDRAAFNLEMAQYILKKLDDGDDRVLNVAGYQLQQAVELFIKHFLETESIGFPFSHDIDTLLDLLEDADTSARLTEDIKALAGTLTLWEVRTKYVKDYLASKRSVFRALDAVEDLFLLNGLNVEKFKISEPAVGNINSF